MTDQPAGASNLRLINSGLDVDSLVSAEITGKKKPGGTLVAAFCREYGFAPHEILVIGKDQRSVLEALNGCAIGFHAGWCGRTSKYGIHIETQDEFLEYLDLFFLKKALWYATYDSSDELGREVVLKTLIDGNGAGSQSLKSNLYDTLKKKQEVYTNGASLSKFMMTHMIASAYLDGLFSVDRNQIVVQIYPGHLPTSQPPVLIQQTIDSFKLFRVKPATVSGGEYGLQRWRVAAQSHKKRMEGHRDEVAFQNQMSTVRLAAKTQVRGKRVIVLDDFHTDGFSLEAARNIYLAAGADTVTLLAFGKYGFKITEAVPKRRNLVKPYEEKSYSDDDFEIVEGRVETNPDALPEFRESLTNMMGTSIADKLLV